MGGCAIDEFGESLPAESLAICKRSEAVLLGAVGGPKWDDLPGDERPEAGLLGIRAGLGVYANLRPAIMFPQLAGACPLKSPPSSRAGWTSWSCESSRAASTSGNGDAAPTALRPGIRSATRSRRSSGSSR